MTVSNTTMEEFKAYCVNMERSDSTSNIDLTVRVLTTGFWPTTTLPKCVLPAPAHKAFDCFSKLVLY